MTQAASQNEDSDRDRLLENGSTVGAHPGRDGSAAGNRGWETPLRYMLAVLLIVRLPTLPMGHEHQCINDILSFGGGFSSGWGGSMLNDMLTDDEDVHGSLTKDIPLSTVWKQLVTSAYVVGSGTGSLMSPVANVVGYRLAMVLVVPALFLSGNVLCMFAAKPAILVGRLLAGFGDGVNTTIGVALIAETATPRLRGTATGLRQVFLSFGIFSSWLVSYFIVKDVSQGWRIIFGLGCVPALALLICGLFVIPESPRWLLRKGQSFEDVKHGLAQIRTPDWDVTAEMHAIQKGMEQEDAQHAGQASISWMSLFRPPYVGPMLMGLVLSLVHSLSGINTFILYSSIIFGMTGFRDPLLGTLAAGSSMLVGNIAGLLGADRVGRRPLLLVGFTLMTVCLLTMSSVLLSGGPPLHTQGIIAIVCSVLFVLGFTVGPGSITFLLTSEVMPNRVRSKAFGIFMLFNRTVVLVQSLFVLSAIHKAGGGASDGDLREGVAIIYYFYGFVTLCGAAFIFATVPETRGKHLEEIQSDLMQHGVCYGCGKTQHADHTPLLPRHVDNAEVEPISTPHAKDASDA